MVCETKSITVTLPLSDYEKLKQYEDVVNGSKHFFECWQDGKWGRLVSLSPTNAFTKLGLEYTKLKEQTDEIFRGLKADVSEKQGEIYKLMNASLNVVPRKRPWYKFW